MFENRKGISTFIATLLLMVLAVSAGVVIYAYTMGYMGGFGGTDTLGAISLDESDMYTDQVQAYVRNIGKTDVVIVSAYIDGELATVTGTTGITEGTVGYVTIAPIPVTAVWGPSKTYSVKLICEDNTQLSFSVKCKSGTAPT